MVRKNVGRLLLRIVVGVAIVSSLSGCLEKKKEEAVTDTPSSTPTPTPALTCTYPGSASGFFPASHGAYVEDPANGTISQLKMYFAGTAIGNHTILATAYECGFGGAVLATASASVTNMQTGSTHTLATFNFSPAFNSPNAATSGCGGKSVVAFKFQVTGGVTTTGSLGAGVIQQSGTSCTIKVATNVTSNPPASQAGWAFFGTVTP